MHVRAALGVIITFVSACGIADADPPIPVVSHCSLYGAERSIVDVLEKSDFAALVSQKSTIENASIGTVTFQIDQLYYGSTDKEFELLVGAPSDSKSYETEILQRLEIHNTPEFLLSYVGLPSVAAYTGIDLENCNAVPVSKPNQLYIIALRGEFVVAFEPVNDENSYLTNWFKYYGDNIAPQYE